MGNGCGLRELCDDFLENIAADISEFTEATTLKVFQLPILKAHKIQEGGVDVTNTDTSPSRAEA